MTISTKTGFFADPHSKTLVLCIECAFRKGLVNFDRPYIGTAVSESHEIKREHLIVLSIGNADGCLTKYNTSNGRNKRINMPQANNKNHFDYDTTTALPHFLSGTNRAHRKCSKGNDEIFCKCFKVLFGMF